MPSTVRGPLQGIRIVDMTLELCGPLAAQILGDLGADIIKVEPPQGDGRRRTGPSRHPAMTSQFLCNNRSKRSIAVDLKTPAGRDVLLRLCKTADVLLYSIRRQAMARLRLGYDDVSKVNPRIVYCGVVGYGEGGPYSTKPAHDDVIQGLTAMPDLQARMTGGPPKYIPFNVVDRNCGLIFTYTILAALLYRERTGEGQAVELPMFEAMADYLLAEHMWGQTFSPPLAPAGNQRAMERWPSRTKDGYICFWFAKDEQFVRLWDAIGRPDMKADERFAKRVNRNHHLVEFFQFMDTQLEKKTTAEWMEAFERADLPAMPMHTLESLLKDPHLRETGFFRMVEHPTEGSIVSMAVPSKWSKSPPLNTRHAPNLGEHTTEVLAEAGYTGSEIEQLLAAKAVFGRA